MVKSSINTRAGSVALAGLLAVFLAAGTAFGAPPRQATGRVQDERTAIRTTGTSESTTTGGRGGSQTGTGRGNRAALLRIVVSPASPAAMLSGKAPVQLGSTTFGAQATPQLYLLGVYDRRLVGGQAFDQRLRLYLPDGSLYEERVIPVDPVATKAATVSRPDLAAHPVPVQAMPRMLRMARAVPGTPLTADTQREATYTTEILPVSGTWITQHGLYGTWTAEMIMERGGRELARTRTTFQLNGNR